VAFFLLLILAAVALGIIGAVVKGLFYLLIIGIVVFLCAFIVLGRRVRRRRRTPVR
jgi:membrane protein implicated in regulation of membrane protease activity